MTLVTHQTDSGDRRHRPEFANQQELAYQYAKKNPGQVYYPWNTLSTLLAEGRVYHFEYGLQDRELAATRSPTLHFRRFVPPKLRQVCFPPARQDEWTMRYLKEFTRRVEIQGTAGWICYMNANNPINLVTGGSGYFGSLPRSAPSRARRAGPHFRPKRMRTTATAGVEFLRGDIRDLDACPKRRLRSAARDRLPLAWRKFLWPTTKTLLLVRQPRRDAESAPRRP